MAMEQQKSKEKKKKIIKIKSGKCSKKRDGESEEIWRRSNDLTE